jgi:hypothetical protein
MDTQLQPPEQPAYPVRFEADYPESLSRLSTFFRLILLIPLAIVVGLLSQTDLFGRGADDAVTVSFGALGSLVLVHWIAVFLRQRPVVWIFDTIVHIQRFTLRASTYFLLMTDRYPPFEGDWPVRYEVERPETLGRWKILVWKVITAIPHLFLLIALGFATVVVTIITWFAIMFTGRFPRGLYDFVAGVLRWEARVTAYVLSLTDEYPPFSLS